MNHGAISSDIALGLKLLRTRIGNCNIPQSALDECFNFASWNIREFGRKPRLDASIHYIAEILNQFDLIAITELRDNLNDLSKVMSILGPYWSVVFSDWVPDRGGNFERVGYLFDKRMIVFTGLAAEADPSRKKNSKTGEYESTVDWWRSPYMASFRAGSFDFTVLAAHIRWGKSIKERKYALERLGEWIDKRRKSDYCFDKDFIVVGDFNIPKTDDPLYKALTTKGLCMPNSLVGKPGANLSRSAHYDQILSYPDIRSCFSDNGGVLDFYCKDYKAFPQYSNLTKSKFTYELSDHMPLWVQINTNREDQELDQILRKRKRG